MEDKKPDKQKGKMSGIVDLTMPVSNRMDSFPVPRHIDTVLEFTVTHNNDNIAVSKYVTSTHTGTHIDAPFHFVKEGKTIDEIEVDSFVGTGVLLDFSHKKAEEEITKDELLTHDKDIKRAEILLIRTDWSNRKWGETDYFYKHPYITTEAAEWLSKQNLKGIGLDTASIDGFKNLQGDDSGAVHKIILGSGLYIIESLIDLGKISDRIFKVYAFPLKLKGADGSPARVVAEIR